VNFAYEHANTAHNTATMPGSDYNAEPTPKAPGWKSPVGV